MLLSIDVFYASDVITMIYMSYVIDVIAVIDVFDVWWYERYCCE